MNIETTVLSNLLHNEEFARKSIVFLKEEYFHDATEKAVFHEIQKFYAKYSDVPTKEALQISVDEREDLSSTIYEEATGLIKSLVKTDNNISFVSFYKCHADNHGSNKFCTFFRKMTRHIDLGTHVVLILSDNVGHRVRRVA